MKKILLYIGSAVFAALMVYNIGAGNLLAKSSDVSLESIKIMAAAAEIENPPGGGTIYYRHRCSHYNNYQECNLVKSSETCDSSLRCP